MTSKSRKKFLITLIIISILVLSFSTIFAATSGQYEYNDYILYNTAGGTVSTGAFRSDFATSSEIGIRVNTSGQWQIYSGASTSSWTTVPAPQNQAVDLQAFNNNGAYVIVNGTYYYFQPHEIQEYFYINAVIPTDPYYPTVSVYFPYSSGGVTPGGVPTTPTVSIIDNELYWLPDNYTAKIIYTSDNIWNGTHTVVSNNATNGFGLYNEGYYKVALNYIDPNTGNNALTDYSNTVHYVPVPISGDIFDKIWSTLKNAFASITNAISTVLGYVTSLQEMLSNILDFMPSDVVTVYWSVVIIALVLSLL